MTKTLSRLCAMLAVLAFMASGACAQANSMFTMVAQNSASIRLADNHRSDTVDLRGGANERMMVQVLTFAPLTAANVQFVGGGSVSLMPGSTATGVITLHNDGTMQGASPRFTVPTGG